MRGLDIWAGSRHIAIGLLEPEYLSGLAKPSSQYHQRGHIRTQCQQHSRTSRERSLSETAVSGLPNAKRERERARVSLGFVV